MSWQDCMLGDVITLKRGHDLPEKNRQPGNVPVVSSSGITGYHNAPKAEPPGVVTGRYGTLGEVFFVEEPFWPLNTALYVIDFKENDPRFVAYLLRNTLRNYQSEKAAVPGVNRNVLHTLPVRAPGLADQTAIAGILSAYDDLIENNRQRIALLEESARLLYREWFVQFRFPGHERVELLDEAARLLYREWFVHLRVPGHERVGMVDGIPDGWTKRHIAELADVFRGKSYKSSELVESDGQPFINLKCIERFGGFRISGLKWFQGQHKDHHLAEPGDIVIAVTDMTRDAMIVAQAARIPKTVGPNAIYSMDLVKLIPRCEIEPEWFYGMLRFSGFSAVVREEATGATVLHLKPQHIEKWEAVLPPKALRGLFSEQFGSILGQMDNLELQIENCVQARDLLLPRLINGEITV